MPDAADNDDANNSKDERGFDKSENNKIRLSTFKIIQDLTFEKLSRTWD
ncbi:MAG: hypothetical protein M3044_21900 [Thermoproteota archaeon]|nr:hypothetical protein [Thermoproteota archaeon]